jgi:ethanolamine phosphate phosphodiesterase
MHLFTSHNSTSLWLYINFEVPTSVVCRGSVVAKTTVRKQQLEPDSSVVAEMSSEMISEDGGKLSRPSKSKLRKVLQRLFRVIQSIVVIAALNAPLYMMLLFKDWIDR